MSQEESFLSRWARLKRESAQVEPVAPAPAGAAAPSQPLPPLESLDFASDFRAFLQDKVEESVKRAALKRLFHSPEFNTMDGLDVYIDDYGIPDPIPPEMLSRLAHARDMLFGPQPESPEVQGEAPASDTHTEALPPAADEESPS